MGWWSTTIMGGDTPLDFKSDFYDKAGVDQFSPLTPKDKEALSGLQDHFVGSGMDDLLNTWGCGESNGEFYIDHKSIGFQVLAVILMSVGTEIKPEMKALMLEWIPQDEWAKEDSERKGHIDKLLKTLNEYTGEPTTVPEKGLFDVWRDKLGQG